MQCRVSCFANYFFRLMRRAFGNQSIPSAFAIFARTRANFRFTLPTSRMPNPLLASSSFIVLALSRGAFPDLCTDDPLCFGFDFPNVESLPGEVLKQNLSAFVLFVPVELAEEFDPFQFLSAVQR